MNPIHSLILDLLRSERGSPLPEAELLDQLQTGKRSKAEAYRAAPDTLPALTFVLKAMQAAVLIERKNGGWRALPDRLEKGPQKEIAFT